MQSNEPLALQTIDRYQSILEAAAKAYNGHIFKSYGDGSLMIFKNGLGAVQAAKEIQNKCRDKNNLQLDGNIIPLRIGIHLGQFVVKGKDIFGHSVNLAARLESLGESGSILFSKEIYEKVADHPELISKSIGTFKVKNVKEKLEVFALDINGFTIPNTSDIKARLKTATPKSRKHTRRDNGMWIVGIISTLVVVAFFVV